MLKIHALQTGRVKVKQFQATGAGNPLSRLWQLFFTRRWSEWLPIYCWLVEHPAGPFLIDAGEISRVHEPGYLPDNFVIRAAVQYEVNREDEVDRQLAKLGCKTEDIRRVYLTHLHTDHMDGICHFPGAEIFASRAAYGFAISRQGASEGYLKQNFPAWFCPETFAFEDAPADGFAGCRKLLADGSLVAVSLPGHSAGHTAYLVQGDGNRYLFAGDATWNERTLRTGVPFVILNNARARESVRRLQEYARSGGRVLCSHDPEAPSLLK